MHDRIVPGQGDYYNPDFITQNNDTIQKHGYLTNLITDDAIDWIENKRNPEKPFCLLTENGFPLTAVNENALFVTHDGEVFLGGIHYQYGKYVLYYSGHVYQE